MSNISQEPIANKETLTIDSSTNAKRTVTVDSNGNVLVPISSASSISDGTKTVTTAGTRVQLSSTSVPCKRVFIQASDANTGTLVVGSVTCIAAQATRRGIALFPSQGDWFYVSDLNLLYIDSTVDSDKVNYLYEV